MLLWGPACSMHFPFGVEARTPVSHFYTVSSGSPSARCCVVVCEATPSTRRCWLAQSEPEPVPRRALLACP